MADAPFVNLPPPIPANQREQEYQTLQQFALMGQFDSLDKLPDGTTQKSVTTNEKTGAGLGYSGMQTVGSDTLIKNLTFSKSNPGVVQTSAEISGSTSSATFVDVASQAFYVPPGTTKMKFSATVSTGYHSANDGTIQTSMRLRLTDGTTSIYSNTYQSPSIRCNYDPSGETVYNTTLTIDNISDTFPNGGTLTVYLQERKDGTCATLNPTAHFHYTYISASLAPEVFS